MSLQDKAVRQIRDSAVYVDLAIGESHSYLGKAVRLISLENDFCTIGIGDEQSDLGTIPPDCG